MFFCIYEVFARPFSDHRFSDLLAASLFRSTSSLDLIGRSSFIRHGIGTATMLLEDLGVLCPDKADSEGHGACGRVTEHVRHESISSEVAFLAG